MIDVDQCYLISERLHEIYSHLKQLCHDSQLPVYDQKRHSGVLRHIVMREGTNTGQILINLVIAQDHLTSPDLQKLWQNFRETLINDPLLSEKVTTFIVTNNSTVSDAVRRAETSPVTLRGDGYIFEELHFNGGKHKIRFRVSPFSFFQTNTLGAQELFGKAASLIQLPADKSVIMDLYCGAGTIGLSLLSQGIGSEVIGIEIVEDAIRDAQYNSTLNNLSDRSYFVAGKTEDLISTDPVIKQKIEQV